MEYFGTCNGRVKICIIATTYNSRYNPMKAECGEAQIVLARKLKKVVWIQQCRIVQSRGRQNTYSHDDSQPSIGGNWIIKMFAEHGTSGQSFYFAKMVNFNDYMNTIKIGTEDETEKKANLIKIKRVVHGRKLGGRTPYYRQDTGKIQGRRNVGRRRMSRLRNLWFGCN